MCSDFRSQCGGLTGAAVASPHLGLSVVFRLDWVTISPSARPVPGHPGYRNGDVPWPNKHQPPSAPRVGWKECVLVCGCGERAYYEPGKTSWVFRRWESSEHRTGTPEAGWQKWRETIHLGRTGEGFLPTPKIQSMHWVEEERILSIRPRCWWGNRGLPDAPGISFQGSREIWVDCYSKTVADRRWPSPCATSLCVGWV